MENTGYDLEKLLMKTYDSKLSENGVSGERLAKRLGRLSQIGLTEDNGSRRPGFSLQEREAKDCVIEWMQEAGLTVREDGAGNIIGRLAGKQPEKPVILSGSHVDTVPNGGHFDGTIGVLSSLEVAQAWKDTGYIPEKPYEVVVFTDEEGSRFNGGLTGSEAMMGDTDIDAMSAKRDFEGRLFGEVISDVGLSVDGFKEAKRSFEEIESFVEVHIEQGKRLEKENLPCGIVTGIAGPYWLKLTFKGLAGHAGNTPMTDRQDALVAAGHFIHYISHLPGKINDSAVATVGNIEVKPNGTNVIPGEVVVYVDIRDIYEESRQQLITSILESAETISQSWGISLETETVHNVAPVPIPKELQEKLKKAASASGITPYALPSGAGHDAMIVGQHLPSALLFVRSKKGISHNPAEWSDLNDCVQTVKVLKHYLESIQKD
ncbi:M20 family metallo-hydrolase [Alkalibacterium olivapovliticus]|uniref:Allantoate deiminase n=1 Tax=Alkalibacterium olivapovliticus TaxID=99907 RepID=A0A2T0VT60_9LACT|nr:M20 family metallo-hydrolase [Alkalibacterium olivapovliticus]PRY73993.1 allantoate deiminase [Alkalibacterium olivapovliticus]